MSTEDLCKKAQAQMEELCREHPFAPLYFTPEERLYIDSQKARLQEQEQVKVEHKGGGKRKRIHRS